MHVTRSHAAQLLSVAFVGSGRMRVLNRTYHGEDRVTDVLTFGQPRHASHRPFLPLPTGGGVRGGGDLGELVVCPSYVRQQAKRAGETFHQELTRVLAHGTLHLLGIDHATPRDAEWMFALQEAVVIEAGGRRAT